MEQPTISGFQIYLPACKICMRLTQCYLLLELTLIFFVVVPHIPVAGKTETLPQRDTPEFPSKGSGQRRTLDLLPASLHMENSQLHFLGIIGRASEWFHFASFQGTLVNLIYVLSFQLCSPPFPIHFYLTFLSLPYLMPACLAGLRKSPQTF